MDYNSLTDKIIGCAIEVHKNLGPGLLESVYEKAMCIELEESGLKYDCQLQLPVSYKGKEIGNHKIDILVEDSVVVELKSTDKMDPVYQAQILSYMKLGNYKLGLLINFNNKLLKDGLKRFIL
jgi:GxxExxY protein